MTAHGATGVVRQLDPQEVRRVQWDLASELSRGATALAALIGCAFGEPPPRRPLTKLQATRQRQGAEQRHKTACHDLAWACRNIRQAVATQYRGATWAHIRHAFGTALPCAPERPADLLRVAASIAQAAKMHPEVCQRAGVRARSLARLARLAQVVAALPAEIRVRRRVARNARGQALRKR